MMDFAAYRIEARRTMPTEKPKDLQLTIATLGLIEELNEFNEVVDSWNNGMDEGGDTLWYMAYLLDLLGLQDWQPVHLADSLSEKQVMRGAAQLCGLIKKYVGHGHALSLPIVQQILSSIFTYIHDAMDFDDEAIFNEGQIYQWNISKLKQRYPNGFTQEASINRVN